MTLPEALPELVREAGGDALLLDARHNRALLTGVDQLELVCRRLSNAGFTRFIDYTAQHLGGADFSFELALRCPAHGHALLTLKWKWTQVGDDAAPSLSRIWPAAGLAERELLEMFGIVFAGNDNLDPLLLPEQFPGFPLRRDYTAPAAPDFAVDVLARRQLDALVAAIKPEPLADSAEIKLPPSFTVPPPLDGEGGWQ
jgi:NADH:ubiquinone oxidoreductase subunit C